MRRYNAVIIVKGVELEVEYEAVYEPARISGPPDRCTPDCSECNVLSMKYSDNQQSIDIVSEEEVEAACWEDFMSRLYDDEPDYDPSED